MLCIYCGGFGYTWGAILVVTPPIVPTPPVDLTELFATPKPAMLKNMKPLVFKGEECDCNKDAIHTFLHKWADLHRLHRTPAAIMAT